MLEIPEGQEHTVYLLGAGFSAERGIPMMDGFVTRMIEANGWLRSEGRTAESDDIIKLLKYRHDISSAALRCVIRPDNIEDLLSAAAAEPADQYQGLDRCIRRAIAATIDYTEKQAVEPKQIGLVLGNTDFNSEKIPPLWKSIESSTYEASAKAVKVPAYDFYVAAMTDLLYERRSGKHTFISYNYDLLLERSLRNMGILISWGRTSSRVTCRHLGASRNRRRFHQPINVACLVPSRCVPAMPDALICSATCAASVFSGRRAPKFIPVQVRRKVQHLKG